MGKRWKILPAAVMGIALMVGPALGQWTGGQNYSTDYGSSTLLQPPSPSGDQLPQSYNAYWHNYLDRLQQQGGYQAITGNYPNSVPITSYYPATASGQTTTQQQAPGQSNLYYSPSQYYATQGAQQYQQPAQPYPAEYQQPAPRAQYQQPAKKRRLSMKKKKRQAPAAPKQSFQEQKAAWAQIRSSYAGQQSYQQPQPYQQQGAYQQPQSYQQQQAYQQPQGYQQPQAYQQPQGYQQQPYQQQQAAYGQPQAVQAQASQGTTFSSDPMVKEAQQKAYERALARQRAAELAAQQQAALQELQQTQKMYESAQNKLQEQEARQKALQEEFHQKAVADAYDKLRDAQQRYYELMGVSGGSGQPQQAPQQMASQQPTQYPQPAQQYPQPIQQQYPRPAQAYNPQPGSPTQGYPVANVQQQPGAAYPTPPGQVTPLRVQGQEQDSGGGFWGKLKEIFAPPGPVAAPTQRSLLDREAGIPSR